jgi:hypothetical protein
MSGQIWRCNSKREGLGHTVTGRKKGWGTLEQREKRNAAPCIRKGLGHFVTTSVGKPDTVIGREKEQGKL